MQGRYLKQSGISILLITGVLISACASSIAQPTSERNTETEKIQSTPKPEQSIDIEESQATSDASCEGISIVNPAGAYCQLMGYTAGIAENETGQFSTCTLPDDTVCDAWEFLSGKCGQEYSYCAMNGYDMETVQEGGDPYSVEYAVCIDEDGNRLGSVTQLSGLQTMIDNCTPH